MDLDIRLAALVALTGQFVITCGFVWLLFRLGRFTVVPLERRRWALLVAAMVAVGLLFLVTGPLPLPLVIATNVVVLAGYIWAWRTGRFSLERVPTELRAEAKRRRDWMQGHRRLLVGLAAGYMVASTAWLAALVALALIVRT